MTCCGDPIITSTTTTPPVVPPPGSDGCLRVRYTCVCVDGVSEWILDPMATACVDNDDCIEFESCSETEFLKETKNACIIAAPLPLPLDVPTCDPECCDPTTPPGTTPPDDPTTPPYEPCPTCDEENPPAAFPVIHYYPCGQYRLVGTYRFRDAMGEPSFESFNETIEAACLWVFLGNSSDEYYILWVDCDCVLHGVGNVFGGVRASDFQVITLNPCPCPRPPDTPTTPPPDTTTTEPPACPVTIDCELITSYSSPDYCGNNYLDDIFLNGTSTGSSFSMVKTTGPGPNNLYYYGVRANVQGLNLCPGYKVRLTLSYNIVYPEDGPIYYALLQRQSDGVILAAFNILPNAVGGNGPLALYHRLAAQIDVDAIFPNDDVIFWISDYLPPIGVPYPHTPAFSASPDIYTNASVYAQMVPLASPFGASPGIPGVNQMSNYSWSVPMSLVLNPTIFDIDHVSGFDSVVGSTFTVTAPFGQSNILQAFVTANALTPIGTTFSMDFIAYSMINSLTDILFGNNNVDIDISVEIFIIDALTGVGFIDAGAKNNDVTCSSYEQLLPFTISNGVSVQSGIRINNKGRIDNGEIFIRGNLGGGGDTGLPIENGTQIQITIRLN